MTKRSRYAYQATLSMLKERIASGGNTIFAEIDQTAAANEAGLQLRPTTLIVFGNPKGGTPLMDAFPLVALELPLKLLVWEGSNGVEIAYVGLVALRTRRMTLYTPDLDDWTWYWILPLASYSAIFGGAIGLEIAPAEALFAVAAGALLLIFIGIRNAWDIVTFLTVGGGAQPPG